MESKTQTPADALAQTSAPANPTDNGANGVQVGGDHYIAPLQHWDFVAKNRLDYIIGNATKYVSRWKKKGGKQDLQKSMHYVDKQIELHAAGIAKPLPFGLKVTVAEFAAANQLGTVETMACELLAGWRSKKDLVMAKTAIQTLLDRAEA